MVMHFDLLDRRVMARIAGANRMTRGAALPFIVLPMADTRAKHVEESLGTTRLYRILRSSLQEA